MGMSVTVLSDDALMLGMDYGWVGDQSLSKLVRLDPDGQVDPAFTSPEWDSQIKTIRAGPSGRVIAASAYDLMCVEPDGQPTPGFTPFSVSEWGISDLAVDQNGRVYVGGRFPTLGRNVIRLSPSGEFDSEYASESNPNMNVLAVALDASGKLLIGGDFTNVGEVFRPYLARLTSDFQTEVAPLIQSQPENQTLYVGSTISLQVEATGFPLYYQWFKGSQSIQGATSPILMIGNASLADAGLYQVVVSNSLGTASSRISTVDVNAYPVQITRQPVSSTVLELSDLALEVEASGTPPIDYQWWKNGAPVEGATLPTLTFNRIGVDQSGSYHVVVSNPAGSTNSEIVELSVEALPVQPFHPGALDVYGHLSGLGTPPTAAGLTRLDDGKLLLFGVIPNDTGLATPYLRRLQSDGSEDASFGYEISPGDFAIAPPATG
jgi:hypothetical protein